VIEERLQTLLLHLDGQLGKLPPPHKPFREALKGAAEVLAQAFRDGIDVVQLVHARASFVDEILQRAWHAHIPNDNDAALVAVGGYGRGELHPASDVDVLILTAEEPDDMAAHLEPLVMFLWDIGLEIGHSVRSLAECVSEARQDLTVVTNLMESRHLAGRKTLHQEMVALTGPSEIWPSSEFFAAKQSEQQLRHEKANDSSQDLEPNIKNNPGGLRDIQMIGWVAKRHFGATRLSDLKRHGFLTESEYGSLKEAEHLLWKIRFGLHLVAGRREDRLLFEHQRALTRLFGYGEGNAAVEAFMQNYYRVTIELQRLGEMLLQLFEEAIVQGNRLGEPQPVNRRYQKRGDYLEVINPGIYARSPLAMLEIFLLMQQHSELKGVRATTIRAIRAHRHLVDERLRNDIRARSLFMEIMRQPSGITRELRRMHRYGILARYIPAFRKITGLMQFDLFHVYTVDEHILMVVRNLRRFTLAEHAQECGLCHELVHQVPKPELLYLSGLFHDIAKGRGGDHSGLGSQDARTFCRGHSLSCYDAELVAWLVEQHLMMSSTAQRMDIDDPEVINRFAAQVGTPERLRYLYLLTVADMRGTNPGLWNSWKGALLSTLYQRTLKLLQRGLDHPEDADTRIQDIQDGARRLLLDEGFPEAAVNLCWINLSAEYFLQTPPDAIAWHTKLLMAQKGRIQKPHVHLREDKQRGCSELFTFGPDRDGLFAGTTAVLDQLGIDILGARIDKSTEGVSINSYFILEADGSKLTPLRQREVCELVARVLEDPIGRGHPASRPLPRRLRSFSCPTEITFEKNSTQRITEMVLSTQDRPGLLSLVGWTLADQGLRLHSARVVTEGAFARDRFTLTDLSDGPILDPDKLEHLKQALSDALRPPGEEVMSQRA